MKKDDTFQIIFNLAIDAPDDPEDFFESAIGLIQYEAVQKGIEFDGYFRERWEIEADHPMTFDDEYFENENRSELFVYLAALVDEEIFDYLHYVWGLVKSEELSEEILHREINILKEKGVSF